MNIIIVINASLLVVLSAVHLYWVFGGEWGLRSSIPEKFADNYFSAANTIRNRIATLIVALGLLVISAVISANYFVPDNQWVLIGTRIIGGLFILRAVGDFNMFGIFKKKSSSNFARSDTKIFIPVCLFLGISSILIVWP